MAKVAPADDEKPALSDTPEFQAAVQAGVDARMKAITDKLDAAKMVDPNNSGPLGVIQMLAAEIAKMNDQGNSRKHVDPAVQATRDLAAERMNEAIGRHRQIAADYREKTGKLFPGRPLYQARAKLYFSDRFIEPFTINPVTRKAEPTRLRWLGVPNQSMYPLNEAAKEIQGFFMKSIGSVITDSKATVALWITGNGLVIEAGTKGGMERTRHGVEREEFDDDDAEIEIENAVLGPGEWDPNRDKINVLGTIAEPATHHTGKSARRASLG